MTIKKCPNCNKRFVVMANTGDYIHQCNDFTESPAITQEDILVIGTWTDFSGSGGKPGGEVMMQGVENELWGQDSMLEGEDVESVTPRDNPKTRFRTRPFFNYIKDPDKV